MESTERASRILRHLLAPAAVANLRRLPILAQLKIEITSGVTDPVPDRGSAFCSRGAG